jgi:photosystem II stability/assembly factor-like uncharacterized protein
MGINVFIGLVAGALGVSAMAADFAIYRRTDDGHSWSVAGRGVPGDLRTDALADEWPVRVTVAGGMVFSGRNPGGVFLSRDGGASWSDGSAGLPENAPTWCLASRGDTVLIGTRGESRLLRYEAAFQHWQPSDQGLPRGASPIALGVGANSALVSVIMDAPCSP